jgi:hypothetical protein
MEDNWIKIAEEIKYGENIQQVIEIVKNTKDKKLLHIIASVYNWDDGFEVPIEIIKNENCDLGTALLLFFLADGVVYLTDENKVIQSDDILWKDFLKKLFEMINKNQFVSMDIAFNPCFSKTEIYKLKKQFPKISELFLYGIDGVNVLVPNI